MNTGMLWFDDDPASTLEKKIIKAVNYYQKKYGRSPDLCLVHPAMLGNNDRRVKIEKITIRPYGSILPGHFWIGIEHQKGF